jgi:hypothetical protein
LFTEVIHGKKFHVENPFFHGKVLEKGCGIALERTWKDNIIP